MKISKTALLPLLKKQGSSLKSLLFYGENEGWVLPEIEKTLHALAISLPRIKRISEEVLLQKKVFLADLVSSASLWGDKDFIIVTGATDKLTPLLKEVLPSIRASDLFIVQTAQYLGPASRLRQLYEKEEDLCSVPCYALDVRTLSVNVKNFFIQEQKTISDALCYQIATLFVEDPSVLTRELEKLRCYIGSKQQVEEGDLAKVLIPLSSEESTKLVLAILRKDKKAVKVECESTILANPVGLIRELLNKMLRLHEAKTLLNAHTPDEVMRKLSPPVFFTEKTQFLEQTRNWTQQELEQQILGLLKLEAHCKLNSPMTEDLFKNFCFQL